MQKSGARFARAIRIGNRSLWSRLVKAVAAQKTGRSLAWAQDEAWIDKI
jgi:hypothetical protein